MTSNIVQVQHQSSGISFNHEEINLLKKSILDDKTTDAELALFSKVCQRTGLDPFARQIFGIRRDGKLTFQTSVDGYRLIADRTRCYAGSDDPVFDEGLSLYQHLQSGRKNPVTATVTVWKIVQGVRCPFVASASWQQYSQTYFDQNIRERKLTPTWAKMPHLMLSKCAESLALRKAFPAELSGIYTSEEFPAEADNFDDRTNSSDGKTQSAKILKQSTPRSVEVLPPVNPVASSAVADTLRRLKWTDFQIQNCLLVNFEKLHPTELTDEELLNFLDYLAVFEQMSKEAKRLGWSKEDGQAALKHKFNQEISSNLTFAQLSEFLSFLKAQQPK